MHERGVMTTWTRAAWTALLATTLAACEGETPVEDPLIDTRSADPVVALRSGSTLSAAATLARFGNAFRANEQNFMLSDEVKADLAVELLGRDVFDAHHAEEGDRRLWEVSNGDRALPSMVDGPAFKLALFQKLPAW